MRNNLRLYYTTLDRLTLWLPKERVTRLRNLALFLTGLYLAASVHLSHIARKWPLPGGLPSLVNRLRRFLDNPRVSVRQFYEPVARSLLDAFRGLPIRLVIDCTKLGFCFRLMTVSIAYKRHTLPLAWSVHSGSRGAVAVAKQIALLDYVRQLIPADSQVWVIGDSGFQHVPLLRWIQQQGWHFHPPDRASQGTLGQQ